MNNKKIFLAVNIIVPLIIGAILYYIAAPDVIFVKMTDLITGGRNHVSIPGFVRNHLLDMFWGYSLVFALFGILGNNTVSIWRIFLMAYIFSAAMEILQATPFIQGTFDVLDIVYLFLAEMAAVFIIKIFTKREEMKDEKEF